MQLQKVRGNQYHFGSSSHATTNKIAKRVRGIDPLTEEAGGFESRNNNKISECHKMTVPQTPRNDKLTIHVQPKLVGVNMETLAKVKQITRTHRDIFEAMEELGRWFTDMDGVNWLVQLLHLRPSVSMDRERKLGVC